MNMKFAWKRILRKFSVLYSCAAVVAVVLFLGFSDSYSQWSDQAPGVFPNIGASGGMLHFKKGVLWGGYKSVSYSLDTGKTWTVSLPSFLGVGETVQNIDFFDALNGLVRTNNYLYITVNGGASWNSQVAPGTTGSRYSAFAGTASTIVSLAREGAYTSINGGASWAKTYAGSTPNIAAYRGAGTMAIFEADHIIISKNDGQTWAALPQSFSIADSYTFMWDPCDSNTLYLANEDYFRRNQNWSEVFVTTDRGNTWVSKLQRPWAYFNGAMAVVPEAAFFQTVSNGIYRTIDYGATWDSINGPGNSADTRWLVALTGNILVGVDQNGNVWRTDNSGGLPISPEAPIFSPPLPQVFNSCTRDTMLITTLASHCKSYYIIKASIAGPDSALFTLNPTKTLPNIINNGNRDSIKIIFDSKKQTGSFVDTIHILWQGAGGPPRDTSFVIRITINPAPIQFVFIPPVVVFDTISPCGGNRDTTILVKNTGCDSIRISNVLYALGNAFSVDTIKLPVILAPDSTLRIRYHFHPFAPGFFNASDVITADWKGIQVSHSISINGRGTTTGFSGAAFNSFLNLDTVSACSPYRDSDVTITNLGCDTMRVTSATVNLGANFSRDPLNFPILIPPGGSVTIHFHFHPSVVGTFSSVATFVVDWQGYSPANLDVFLKGSSNRSKAGPLVADTVIGFGTVSACYPFGDTTVTIRNRSCDTLKILSGPGSLGGDFGMDPIKYPIILPPDSSLTLTFHCLRSGVGNYKGSAKFVTSREGIVQNLSLLINGKINSSVAGALVQNALVDFGNVTTCDPLRDTTIILTNPGCDTLRILSGPVALGQGFTIDPLQYPIILPPNSSVFLRFHFNSPGVGPYVIQPHFLTERSGVKDSFDLSLHGVGVEGSSLLSLSASDFSFNPVSFCSNDSAEINYTNLGCDTLFVTPLGESGDADFISSAGSEKALLPGDSIHIHVYFLPQKHGQCLGSYRLRYRSRFGISRDTMLAISGMVTPGKRRLNQSLSAIDFGTTTLCGAPDSVVIFTNQGCDTLTIESAALSDAGFLIGEKTFPIIVQPGEKIILQVATTLDTAGGKPRSSAKLNVSCTGDTVITPIVLTREYSYPKKYPLRFEVASDGHHAGDTAKVRIIADSLPSDLTTLEATFSATNPDMLTYLFAKSTSSISIIGNTLTFTGNPVVAPKGVLAELSYKVYLTKDSISTFSLSGVRFNSYNADYENCIALSTDKPSDSVLYNFACGERTIQSAMNDDLAARLLGVYPNPARGEITLDINTIKAEDCNITISDAKGNIVLRSHNVHPQGRSGISVDISNLPSAAYYVKINAGASHLVTTFVKEK